MRYAAIGLLAIVSYFAFFYNQATTYTTQLAQQTTVQLPDASSVTLNAMSSLEYRAKTWDENREVLLKGEAYFKVAKGATFDVVTNQGVVRVLGTQFTVKQRDSYFEVQCFEGKVGVIKGDLITELLPGDAFRIIDGKTQAFSFNQDEPSWINNRSTFNKVPLQQVLAEFERQYDITINANQIDTSILFHGVFVNDNLDNALKQITLPLSLTYVINNDQTVTLTSLEAK
jgi:ferric-dicitrate binding protein FerR (iron transport regulator)